MTSLKLISLNIELHLHIPEVARFLSEEQPDVVCLQEVRVTDMGSLCEALSPDIGDIEYMLFPNYHWWRSPLYSDEARIGGHEEGDSSLCEYGLAILCRGSARFTEHHYAGLAEPTFTEFDEKEFSAAKEQALQRYILGGIEVMKDGVPYKIFTTHFPISDMYSRVNDFQREAMASMLGILSTQGEYVLCGDFNTSRHSAAPDDELWNMMTAQMRDNIPAEINSSIDNTIHRAGKTGLDFEKLRILVDGVFSTPAYIVSEVEMISGVSDHKAVRCFVRRGD